MMKEHNKILFIYRSVKKHLISCSQFLILRLLHNFKKIIFSKFIDIIRENRVFRSNTIQTETIDELN